MTRELTAAEQAKPYAKYYYRQPTPPTAQQLKALEQPINPELALMPQDINRLLDEGYMECEAGYCQLPDGSVYVANITQMSGVTTQMLDWWFAWHPLEDLRYMLWYPKDHYGIAISDEVRAQIVNPENTMQQKLWGAVHTVVENTGEVGNIQISFMSPESMGFDVSRYPQDGSMTLVGANGLSWGLKAPADAPKAPAIMCHLARKTADGIELRTRFWMGWQIVNGKPVKVIPDEVRIPNFAGKALLKHGIEEYTNLAAILPQLYTEMEGKIG